MFKRRHAHCQYNTAGGGPGGGNPVPFALAPYPLKLSSARVTVEDAPVRFVNPAHPLLTTPNKITGEDFSGWFKSAASTFVTDYDQEKYTAALRHERPGREEHLGSTVVAQHGKGTYIYTSLAWFRELPAGVPGAYRLFANFLSAGKSGGGK